MADFAASPWAFLGLVIAVIILIVLVLLIWVIVIDLRTKGMVDDMNADRRQVEALQVVLKRDMPHRFSPEVYSRNTTAQPPVQSSAQTPMQTTAPRQSVRSTSVWPEPAPQALRPEAQSAVQRSPRPEAQYSPQPQAPLRRGKHAR